MNDELRLIEMAVSHHHLVGPKEVRAAGIRPERWRRWLDTGEWVQVAPKRFRHVATPLTFEMSVRAGAAWLGRRGGLYAAGALFWLGVEVEEPTRAEFLVPRSTRSIPNWMTVHTTVAWDERDVTRHRGIRTTTATRALLDYAAQGARAREVAQAIDSAIRLRRTALSRVKARAAELGGRGRPGTVLIRELLLDSGGESLLERRFLRLVREAGYARPDCQVVFRNKGRTVARVDFFFPGANVVVEVSGRLGHSTDDDRRRDAHRRNAVQRAGTVVVEFTTVDVIDDPGYVLGTLREWLGAP